MNFQYIRDKYRVPAKRGVIVRENYSSEKAEGRITGTPKHHARLNMITNDGQKLCLHPFELDYFIDGNWISGEDLQHKYDSAWDRWNARANELIAASKSA